MGDLKQDQPKAFWERLLLSRTRLKLKTTHILQEMDKWEEVLRREAKVESWGLCQKSHDISGIKVTGKGGGAISDHSEQGSTIARHRKRLMDSKSRTDAQTFTNSEF